MPQRKTKKARVQHIIVEPDEPSKEPYEATPPPEEDFGEDGLEGEVEAIKSAEYTTLGETFYEVKWAHWKRKDGTDTTWERTQGPGYESALEDWNTAQTRQRAEEATISRAINVQKVTWLAPGVLLPLADVRAAEEAQAFPEKLAKVDEDELQNTITSISAIMHYTPSAPGPSRHRRGMSPPISQGTSPPISRSTSRRHESEPMSIHSRSTSSSGEAVRPPRPRRILRVPHPVRDKLNDLWAEGAAATEAASVTFVNEEDDEDAPIPANFRYLEHRYEVSDDCALPANYKRPDLLVGCLCALGECSPNGCWDNEMDDDTRSYVHSTPAYDPHGRFKHTSGQQIMYTVVECNNNCSCGSICPNRVAQKPRDVQLQIFKTKHRGWGVRTPKALPKGKVIGIFTGKLITREEADDIDGERKFYVFDLNTQEELHAADTLDEPVLHHDDDKDSHIIIIDDDEPPRPRPRRPAPPLWSVDAYEAGNWSRFINHACVPNMKVFSVVWDSVAAARIPYLAFVTTKKVAANQELTIDYYPGARSPESEGEDIDSEDGNYLKCHCTSGNSKGHSKCRGWLPLH